MTELRILPVAGIGEVRPGDDLADLIIKAAPWLADGDVLVVTSKIVSKAEGRLVELPPPGPQREAVRAAVLAEQTARPVARRGPTRIVATHHGLVLASAGIDASNVDSTRLVLLPEEPDRSARELRAALRRHGRDVAVIITDTMGRPWRLGLVDVAIGAAGIEPLVDYRGRRDRHGNELQVTVTAVADELAAAAELVKGKLSDVPVAVVRGYPEVGGSDGPGATALIRGADLDLFPMGTAEARDDGMRRAASLVDPAEFADLDVPDAAGDFPQYRMGELIDRAIEQVTRAMRVTRTMRATGDAPAGPAPLSRVLDDRARKELRSLLPPHAGEVVVAWAGHDPAGLPDPWELMSIGAGVQRLRAALAAEGLGLAWVAAEPEAVLRALAPGEPAGWPLGLLGVGVPVRA